MALSKEFDAYDEMIQAKYPIMKRPQKEGNIRPNANYTIYE